MSDNDHIVEVPMEQPSNQDTSAHPSIKATSAFFDENYTYADRDRELGLLENLLTMQLQNVRMERVLIHHTLSQPQN